MTAPELKPCPFCGGDVKLVEGEESAFIQCLKVSGHRAIFLQGDNAISDEVVEMWNTRTDLIPAIIDKAVAAERERCAKIADAIAVSAHLAIGLAADDETTTRVGAASYAKSAEHIASDIRKGAKP